MIKECSEKRLNKPSRLSPPDIMLSDYIVGKVGKRLSQKQKKKQRRAQAMHGELCETNLCLTPIELDSPDSSVKQISDTGTVGKDEVKIKKMMLT